MNAVAHEQDSGPRQQFFNCNHADCGATFKREWRLKEHETVHTGAQPFQCEVAECGRSFSRKSHLKTISFYLPSSQCAECYIDLLNFPHVQCNFPNCLLTFKKRRVYKLHLKELNYSVPGFLFRCSKRGCGVRFDTHVARKAHEKKHAGLNPVVTFASLLSLQPHSPVKLCQKVFKHVDSLRRHKWTHTLQKPVLLCPSSGCKAYVSTTFNLQHHIHKAHLQLLKYHCYFPDCHRTFAMRESLSRHLAHHDPDANPEKKRKRPKKYWQKRLEGHQLPLVEDDLRHLFALRMRVSRRTKVEVNLSGPSRTLPCGGHTMTPQSKPPVEGES
uniref:C2H2-type domain-containing protein n=1 Tax=Oncorhynchus tshawytscha TaxID=74940 RepID=A0A8C8GZA6_ONCTS